MLIVYRQERTGVLVTDKVKGAECLKQKILIPCCIDRKTGAGEKFHPMNKASIKNFNRSFSACVTSRYYKGASGDNDNMVLEIIYEGD